MSDTPPLNPGDEGPEDAPGVGENTCRTCQGTGRLDDAPCTTCGGTGVVEEGIGGG